MSHLRPFHSHTSHHLIAVGNVQCHKLKNRPSKIGPVQYFTKNVNEDIKMHLSILQRICVSLCSDNGCVPDPFPTEAQLMCCG